MSENPGNGLDNRLEYGAEKEEDYNKQEYAEFHKSPVRLLLAPELGHGKVEHLPAIKRTDRNHVGKANAKAQRCDKGKKLLNP